MAARLYHYCESILTILIFQASYYGRGNPTYWVANNEVSETGEEATNLVILWSGTSVCL